MKPKIVRKHILFQLFPLVEGLRTISLNFPGTVQTLSDSVQCKILPSVFADLLKPILQQRSLVRVALTSVPADVLWCCSPSITHMTLARVFPSLLLYPYDSKPMKLQVESLYLDNGYCLNWLVCIPIHNFAHLRKLSINIFDCLQNCRSHRRTSRSLEHCFDFPKLEALSVHVTPCQHSKQVGIFIAQYYLMTLNRFSSVVELSRFASASDQ